MGYQPQVSLDMIRQTSTASGKKIFGLDTNQALLGSERSHSRSAWLMAHHLEMGCSSLPEGRRIVMVQVNKRLRVSKRRYIQQQFLQQSVAG